MKEMYLKVEVEDNTYSDFRDVYYRDGMCFMCHKDDKKLVEIEDAENKGAEKLLDAIKRLTFYINNNGKDRVTELFGHANIEMILCEFAPYRIIELVKELDCHIPKEGDIYVSKESGNKVVVMAYDLRTYRVRYMAFNYVCNNTLNVFNNDFSFTGSNFGGFGTLLRTLALKEGR